MKTISTLMLTEDERNSLMKANDILMHYAMTDAGKEDEKAWMWVIENKKIKNVSDLVSTVLYDIFNASTLEWEEPTSSL